MTTTTIEKPADAAPDTLRFCMKDCRKYYTLEAVKRFAPICEQQCWLYPPYSEKENMNETISTR